MVNRTWANYYKNPKTGEHVYLGDKSTYVINSNKVFKKVQKIDAYLFKSDLVKDSWKGKDSWTNKELGLLYQKIHPKAINYFNRYKVDFGFYNYFLDNVLEVCSNYKVLSWTVDYFQHGVKIIIKDEKHYIFFIEWLERFFNFLSDYSVKSISLNGLIFSESIDWISFFESMDKSENEVIILCEKDVTESIGDVFFIEIKDSGFDDTTILNYKNK